MKIWDAIIIGAGIIGLSLAIELRKRGMTVLVVEKGESGREASWAAGGMLADFPLEMPPALHELAHASAQMYPEFVHQLEDESRLKIDLRAQGTMLFLDSDQHGQVQSMHPLPAPLAELEPAIVPCVGKTPPRVAYLSERSVDPRGLVTAAIGAARHRGVDFSSGDQVLEVEAADDKAVGIRTNRTRFAGGAVVNCAGAWAGQISLATRPVSAHGGTGAPPARTERSSAGVRSIPTRPVKGQMLCVAMPQRELLRHVIRTPDVYLIPRSDGRLLIGATLEEAGFDKQTVPATIQKLRQSALDLVPRLAEARLLEAWAGLRPGTPDKLPILGATPVRNYYVATGHFRDGILLAPVTARVMGQLMAEQRTDLDLSAFASERFRG